MEVLLTLAEQRLGSLVQHISILSTVCQKIGYQKAQVLMATGTTTYFYLNYA